MKNLRPVLNERLAWSLTARRARSTSSCWGRRNAMAPFHQRRRLGRTMRVPASVWPFSLEKALS
jgi:hypothetical protein